MIPAVKRGKKLSPKKAYPRTMLSTAREGATPGVVERDTPSGDSNETGSSKNATPTCFLASPKLADTEASALQHVLYTDFSHVKPDEGAIQIAANKEPTFIVKLHQMLSNPDISDIISWLPHGRAWRILQRKAFEDRVIPLYFRHCRYSSFMRQVNGWGFRRVTNGTDYNAYYHEMFLRGMPHLCYKMRRLTTKDGRAKGRHPKEVEDEPSPDFYRLTEEHPLPQSKPVPPPPTLRAQMTGSYDAPVSGQLLFSGTQPGVSDSTPSRNQSLSAVMSSSLLPASIEAMQIHQRANNGLGLMIGAVRPDMALGLSQTLYPSLHSTTYTSLLGPYSASIGAGGNCLLSGESFELQHLINIERRKAAAAEMARVAAMNNLLSLRKASEERNSL